MNKLNYLALALATAMVFSSCSRDDDNIPEIIPSDGTKLTLEGGMGGASAANSVFVDLSTDKQSSVARTSWNLGFHGGSEFRVILNNTAGASAIKVDKTDINAVSSGDINLDDLTIPLGTPGAFDNIEDVTGDITKTLIPEITTEESGNAVFVINPVGGSHGSAITADDLYKVRILRAGNDYTLHYAKLNETTHQTLTIEKDDDYNFKYISFSNGPVNVEPAKADWDFQWTWSLYFGAMPTGATYPYGFSDLVFINHLAGVSAAEVLASTVAYSDFDESNLSGISFSTAKDAIGSDWRITSSPYTGALQDRYYLIKDAAGNVYKVKFISMGAKDPNAAPVDGGTRGYPELEYKLVKRG